VTCDHAVVTKPMAVLNFHVAVTYCRHCGHVVSQERITDKQRMRWAWGLT
jgi:hypothetical protein